MKKAEIKMLLEEASEGHRLVLTHYWVRGVYLIRITDQDNKKKYPGGYVVVEDDMTNVEADRRKIDWIIRLRDKVEELQDMATYNHDDAPDLDLGGLPECDLEGLPDYDLDTVLPRTAGEEGGADD